MSCYKEISKKFIRKLLGTRDGVGSMGLRNRFLLFPFFKMDASFHFFLLLKTENLSASSNVETGYLSFFSFFFIQLR